MYDSNLLLMNEDNAVVADSPITGTGKLLGPDLVPATWMTYVPEVAATTTPSMVVTIEESDDNLTYAVINTRTITAAGVFFDTVISSKKYRRVVLTITGTSADFNTVVVGKVPAGRYDKY